MPFPPVTAHDELRDRFRACLLGCAIGDALGFPFEGATPEAIVRVPELAEDFRNRGRYARGQYTDDTQMTLALAASIAEEGKVDGRAVAARFAALWRDGIILQADEATTVAVHRLLEGTPWMSAGSPVGHASNGAAMRAAPIGLWHCDQPSRILRDAEVQGVITHKDPRALAGAAAFAMAIALALEEGEPVPRRFALEVAQAADGLDDGVAEALRQVSRMVKWEPRAALTQLVRSGLQPHELGETRGCPTHVVPTVCTAIWLFLRHPGDFRAAVRGALEVGGDVDTLAAMVGALCGAHLGTPGLPARLRRGVLHADVAIDIADHLYARKFEPSPTPALQHARSTVRGRR